MNTTPQAWSILKRIGYFHASATENLCIKQCSFGTSQNWYLNADLESNIKLHTKTADVKKHFAIRSQASCNIDKQKILFSVELLGLVEIKDGVKTGQTPFSCFLSHFKQFLLILNFFRWFHIWNKEKLLKMNKKL